MVFLSTFQPVCTSESLWEVSDDQEDIPSEGHLGTSQLSGSTRIDTLFYMKLNGLGFVLYLFVGIRKSDPGSVHGRMSLLE